MSWGQQLRLNLQLLLTCSTHEEAHDLIDEVLEAIGIKKTPGSSAPLQTMPPRDSPERGKSGARCTTDSYTMASRNVIHCCLSLPTPFRPRSGPPLETESTDVSQKGDGQEPVAAETKSSLLGLRPLDDAKLSAANAS
eukprot:CAMPEP_0115133390 /NCGR_PEP_ID=MMETSP0227-20121206/54399_1 /TAXON_ID=89957 /ORGANISM="Polarella glacialis, Strain CCMP 1383" /LENGTH=137 /DNA_ID=CAMNT_0002539523 /DNA_START=221 /DNA_END=632 /DNA_ORIENTATION=-